MTDRPSFEKVAAILANGAQPEWLLAGLKYFSRFVGLPKKDKKPDLEEEKKMLEAAKYLEDRLRIYELHEAWNFECPDCVSNVRALLPEVIEFLEKDIEVLEVPKTARDGRRLICAGVAAGAWRLLHGQVQPNSLRLQQACEDYWQACGHPQTGEWGEPRNWFRHLETVRDDNNDWVLGILENYRTGSHT
jgi:hypothetical protein